MRGDPAQGPVPKTMLHTPLGNPASLKTLHNKYAVTDVNSDGLQTAVHPNAKQGAIFHVNK